MKINCKNKKNVYRSEKKLYIGESVNIIGANTVRTSNREKNDLKKKKEEAVGSINTQLCLIGEHRATREKNNLEEKRKV